MKQFRNLEDAQHLALAIVDTFPEPFVVLDGELNVLAGSRFFYQFFKEEASEVRGRSFFKLGGGQWDIPELRRLIETVIPEHTSARHPIRSTSTNRFSQRHETGRYST